MTISGVQNNFSAPATASAATSVAGTLASGIANGNLLVAQIVCSASGTPIVLPSSSWSQVFNDQPGGLRVAVAWLPIAAAQAGQTSWTFTGPSSSWVLGLSEWHALAGWQVSPIPLSVLALPGDQSAIGFITPGAGASGSVDSGTAQPDIQAEELWMAALAYLGAAQTLTGITAGWTNDFNSAISTAVSLAAFHQLASSIGSAHVNAQIATAEFWGGALVTFADIPPVLGTDSGTGTDAGSVVVNVSSSDSGTGTDTGVIPPPSPDAGTGTDTGSVLARVSSSDSGTGTDTGFPPISSTDAGTGTDTGSVVVNVSSSDAGSGADSGSVVLLFRVSSSDSGSGSDTQLAPGYSPSDFDGAHGADTAFIEPLAPTPLGSIAMEGFSLTRAAVLSASGVESVQMYSAKAIALVPNTSVVTSLADDEVLNIWAILNSAQIIVNAGFMPFTTLGQLMGTGYFSSGLSPADYYALPLWTQYQHNQPQVSLVVRASSRNSVGATRTMDMVLYRVSLSVLDFTGVVYKTGLQVNYQGKIMFSSVDEVGNTLPGLEVGRIISYPGTLTGAFAALPFRGT